MSESKSMGLWSATSIGVGAMVGAGIFSIFGTATQISGNAVYVSFIIAGAIALLSTYSYAKLGARYPSAGGPVEFLIQGFGDGILSGGLNLLLWSGYVFGLSLYAKGFSLYAMTFMPADAGINLVKCICNNNYFSFHSHQFHRSKSCWKIRTLHRIG